VKDYYPCAKKWFIEKVTENFVTNVNSKANCKETEVTVTSKRSKSHDVAVVKAAS